MTAPSAVAMDRKERLAELKAYVLGRAQAIVSSLRVPNLRIPSSTVDVIGETIYVHLYPDNRRPFAIEIKLERFQLDSLSSPTFGEEIDVQVKNCISVQSSERRDGDPRTGYSYLVPVLLTIVITMVVGLGVYLATEFSKLRTEYYTFKSEIENSVRQTDRTVDDHFQVLEEVWSLMVNETKVRTILEEQKVSLYTALSLVVEENSNLMASTNVDSNEVVGRAALIWRGIARARPARREQ